MLLLAYVNHPTYSRLVPIVTILREEQVTSCSADCSIDPTDFQSFARARMACPGNFVPADKLEKLGQEASRSGEEEV
jgi:hypothetical protein